MSPSLGFLALCLFSTVLSRPANRPQSNFEGDTQNGFSGECKLLIVIFARGTTEPGNVGTTVGPSFFQAIAEQIGGDSLAAQGVDYPANVLGFLEGGDPDGSELMADLVEQAVNQCPETQVVLSGFSQGGQLVHNAAARLPTKVTGRIAAAVIFGDPYNGEPVGGVSADRTLVICHEGDNICEGGLIVYPTHLTYGTENAREAADFVMNVAGL